MATTEELKIKITEQGAKKTAKELDGLADSTKKVGDESEESGKKAGRFGNFLSTDVSDGVKKAAGAIIAAVAALGTMTIKITAANDLLNKQAQALGISTEAISELSFAFKRGGVDQAGMSTAIRTLTRVISEADQGVGEYVETVARLGIQTTDAEGKLLSFDELLPQIADKFKDMENGTEKSALALELFGRQGQKMIPVLNEGADGIEKLRGRANELGATLSQDVADAATQFQDTLTDVKTKAGGLAQEVTFVVLPAFQLWAEGLVTLIPSLERVRDLMELGSDATDPLTVSLDAQTKALNDVGNEIFELDKQLHLLEATGQATGATYDEFGARGGELLLKQIRLEESIAELNKKLSGTGDTAAPKAARGIRSIGAAADEAIPVIEELNRVVDTFADNPPPKVTIVDKKQLADDIVSLSENVDAFNLAQDEMTEVSRSSSAERQETLSRENEVMTGLFSEFTSLAGSALDKLGESGDKTDKIVAKIGKTIFDVITKIILTQAVQTTSTVANAGIQGAAVTTEMAAITAAATPAAVATSIATEGGSAAAGSAGVIAAIAAIVPAIAGIFVGDEGFLPDIKQAVAGRRTLGIFQPGEGVVDARTTGSLQRGASMFEAAASQATTSAGNAPQTVVLEVPNLVVGERYREEVILRDVNSALKRGEIGLR